MAKSFKSIRIYKEDWEKINKTRRELSTIENKDVKTAELVRRMTRVPNIKFVLEKDSLIKRRIR